MITMESGTRQMLQGLSDWFLRKPRLSPDRCRYVLEAAIPNAVLIDHYIQILGLLHPAVFCDIGAYDGQAAGLVRNAIPNTAIYAFEANPEVYNYFSESPHLARIFYENFAICERDGVTRILAPRTVTKMYSSSGMEAGTCIEEPPLTKKSSLRRRNGETTYAEYQVSARRLDSVLQAHLNAGESFALWIDVEGAVDRVLSGAHKVLGRTLAIFVELENYDFWRRQAKSAAIVRRLEKLGFTPLARDDEFGEYQYNVLFVRSDSLPKIEDWLKRHGRRARFPET